jgi:phospho-N-acetylmuramoyl-pentapeptide-transferase
MYLVCLATFICTILFGPLVIKALKRFQFGQSIREEGPASHKKKAGTPTLGGSIFLIPVLVSILFFMDLSNEIIFLLILMFGYALIGFIDDFIKIGMKRNLGLTSKQKLTLQIALAAVAYWVLSLIGIDTNVFVPGTNLSIDLSWGYFLFFVFLVVGTTNATNLTDGLDGLLTGLSILAFGTFSVIAFAMGNHEIFTFTLIVLGSLLGFLFYNVNPAKVFMGDTGSLALGGGLVGIAVLTKNELLLAIIGGVFVIETLSVIIQVISFKTRKKRVFLMTPIHHSFEQIGWSEQKVVARFWFMGLICSLVSLTLFTF